MPAADRAANELTPHAIGKQLGVKPDWVKRRLEKEPHRVVLHHGQKIFLYNSSVIPKLARELDANRRLKPLGEYLTVPMIAWKVGCSPATVRSRLRAMGVKPLKRVDGSGRIVKCYPKRVIGLLSEPTAGPNMINIWQLTKVTGLDGITLQRRLAKLQITGTLMRSPVTGRVVFFYPVEALEQLPRKRVTLPAGEWLTVQAICRSLGKSRNWVNRRIRQNGLEAHARPRKDDMGAVRLHYPPAAVRLLRDIMYAELQEHLQKFCGSQLSA